MVFTTAAHIINFDPANERWTYVKTGYNGPGMGVSRDGKHIMAGSFVPHMLTFLPLH